jgi:uncharacterized protein
VNLFYREKDTIDTSNGLGSKSTIIDAAINATKSNSLFLSMCDAFNITEAKIILNWFKHFSILDGLEGTGARNTVELLKDKKYSEKISNYLASLQLGMKGIVTSETPFQESDFAPHTPDIIKQTLLKSKKTKVEAMHQMYDAKGMPVKELLHWDFEKNESTGTRKALALSGPVIWTLANGGVLIIDELEAAMHPIMTLNTIELFLDATTNPKQAQLIFITHDTNLLSYASLRRDQICFAEKNKWENTELYSLADMVYVSNKDGKEVTEKERPDSDKERRYIEGRYGAIPLLGKFKQNFAKELWH